MADAVCCCGSCGRGVLELGESFEFGDEKVAGTEGDDSYDASSWKVSLLQLEDLKIWHEGRVYIVSI